MKHLKLYENSIIPKYKKDDYVLLNITRIISDDSFSDFKLDTYKNYGKIMFSPIIDKNDKKDPILYDIFYLNNNDFKLTEIQSMYIPEEYIIRKLNSKEKEEFDILITADKYNL